jgi:hypothetical protein
MIVAMRAIWDCWQKGRHSIFSGILSPDPDDAVFQPQTYGLSHAPHLYCRRQPAYVSPGWGTV